MRLLTEVLMRQNAIALAPITPPHATTQIERAIEKVQARWPDIVPAERPNDLLVLRRFARREAEWNWEGATLSEANIAARAAFKAEHLQDPEFDDVRLFLIEECAESRRRGFLGPMADIYLSAWKRGSPLTEALAIALDAAKDRCPSHWLRLVTRLPEVLDPRDGPKRLAARMAKHEAPFKWLVDAGLRSPHGRGFMDETHIAYVEIMASALKVPEHQAVTALLRWCRPPDRPARETGAELAIQAIVGPWRKSDPKLNDRRFILDRLLETFGHPRSGTVWSRVAKEDRQVVARWMVGKTLEAFFEVVGRVDTRHMWGDRERFWRELHRQERIVDAWIALPESNVDAENAWRDITGLDDPRSHGVLTSSDSQTCLIVMRLAPRGKNGPHRIVLEGSHNHPLFIYSEGREGCPHLGERRYDRYGIRQRYASLGATRIVHNGDWQNKALEHL